MIDANAGGPDDLLKFWPQLQSEVSQWKFNPLERNGVPVTTEIEEYLDVVPPERLPSKHVIRPRVLPTSKVDITLRRSGCYGTCPSYAVAVATDSLSFSCGGYVVASGEHGDTIDAKEVRALARKFAAADFYSMDASYRANVTDCPTFVLAITIDGKTKQVEDYVGAWEGMPSIISELEDDVDAMAHDQRWINGTEGLVRSLQSENFNFQRTAAQDILKQAAARGEAVTLSELLAACVPLKPIPPPAPMQPGSSAAFNQSAGLAPAAPILKSSKFSPMRAQVGTIKTIKIARWRTPRIRGRRQPFAHSSPTEQIPMSISGNSLSPTASAT